MKTYNIYTLGCKVNQYDSGKLASNLARAGIIAVKKNADIAIINSCAVTKTAMIKSGRMIKLAKKENPQAKIVLAGCWPKAEAVNNIVGVDLILEGTGVLKFLTKLKIKENKNNKLTDQTEHSRYFIKIQDGCEQYCTYCIIPYTRGKLKSRGEQEVVTEIKQAIEAGYSEIVLSGIHLGLYGKDKINNENNLFKLLKKVIKINQLGRIRLSSIEITEVTDEMIKLIAGSEKICQHLHIPLQAGNDKILKLMNRPYDIKYFANRIKRIRRAMPDMAISTDVIVGFPGETEKDFKTTEKFIKKIKFSRLHVFSYSAHAKLPAAKFAGQVEEKIKARRAKILRDLSVKLAEDYKNKFKGKNLEVAIEQIKQGKIIGKSEYYFDIEIPRKNIKNRDLKVGQIVMLRF